MALSAAQLKSLVKKQEEEVIIPEGTIDFVDSIELSAQSPQLSGLAKLIGKTKSGNLRFVMTTKDGHFKFYSKEELESPQVIDHSFGIQTIKELDEDGKAKKLYWY